MRGLSPQAPVTDRLVSTSWLEERLGDPSVVVLEVSMNTLDRAEYGSGHVPGARFVYWKDLLWHGSDRQFPGPELMAERLGALGVAEASTIALLGDPFQFGAYAFWVLTMAGQEDRCRLVDGGRRTWIGEERPLTDRAPEVVDKSISVRQADATSRIGRDEILQGLGEPSRALIDLRSPEEYHGERVSPSWMAFDHGAERKGHIPGGLHLFFEDLLRDDGTLLPPDELWARFDALEIDEDAEIVTYCRLSHRASLGWFVLTRILGRPDVRVYDGSWTEWGSIVGVPIER